MRFLKRFGLPLCFMIMVLLAAEPLAAGDGVPASGHGRATECASGGVKRAPRYVSLCIEPRVEALVAGERGSLELKASLPETVDASGQGVTWDRNARAPLIVWVSTRQSSGISFIDKANPERPRHHILVEFAHPQDGHEKLVTKKIEYMVEPRTKTGKHYFWLDVFAELRGADGSKIYDAGIATMPINVDTHLRTKLLMLAVVGLAVFLFIVEWVRVDVVAIAMMVLLPELGLLNSGDTFRGLSSNAVVAIIGVMIISYGLNRAGLVHRVLQPILGLVSRGSRWLVISFSSLIAALSGVMQNTGAAVLFLPAIRSVTAYRLKIPLTRVLMPIGMAAILGGTLTMIGTSPLILLNDILPPGMAKFGLLELTPIGLALAVAGIAYLSTGGMRFLASIPVKQSEQSAQGADDGAEEPLASYPFISGPHEILVPEDYRPGDAPQELSEIKRRYLVSIVGTATTDGACAAAPAPNTSIRAGLALCVYGPSDGVKRLVADYGLVLRDRPLTFRKTMFNRSVAGVVEGVVSPRSGLVGRTIKEARFQETFGVTPLAVHQDGDIHYGSMGDIPLRAGDTLLLQGMWERFQALQELRRNLIVITPFEHEYQKPEKAKWALVSFLGALALMLLSSFYFQSKPYNPIPLSVCLMVGALAMVVTRVVSISEAYHAVDWRTVFLLGGLIPLGMAVDQTGTAQWIAQGLVAGLGSLMSPLVLLILLACLSAAFTLVISNVGACTLLVPLGISIANHIGMDPRVAALVVGLGVSNSFLLPTHQVNALYMGPGEYRTKDYIKIGGILSVIYVAVLVAMAYLFYL